MIKFTTSALLLVSAVAGAQTVTVGTTSSTTNGTTTTITVPVSVAVPPAATTSGLPAMASFRAEVGAPDGGRAGQVFGAAFTPVKLTNVIVDTASGWNAANNTYTAPATGTYLIVSTFRLADSAPQHMSYGQGVNTTNVDNTAFIWTETGATLRNGFINTRIMQLSAGQSVVFFAVVDNPTPVALGVATLSIQQLP